MGWFKKKEKEKTAEEWFNLGVQEDDHEKQLEYFTKALEIEPQVVIRWIVKGQALINYGRYEAAIICCDKALEIDPENASSWNIKGIALQNLDRNDEAIKCYEKALVFDPDYDSAKQNLIILKSILT